MKKRRITTNTQMQPQDINSPQNNVVDNASSEATPLMSGAENEQDTDIKSKKVSFTDLLNAFSSGYGESATEAGKNKTISVVSQLLKQAAKESPIFDKYNILVLYDNSTLVKTDADKIYDAVTKLQSKKPILFVIYSRGGEPAAAYFIGKLCREYSDGNVIASIPRHAKSAATLICCAANEIHMGSLSELGPIDPQIKELPVLGLKNSIEHIAELVKMHPTSSDMFAQYLHYSLDLINLGHYERVAESAVQYAEKLLSTHSDNLPKSAKDIAFDLVYKYKDHSFVIDKAEAVEIFGSEIIKSNSEEYELGNKLYQQLDIIRLVASVFRYNFYLIGSLDSTPIFTKYSE